MDVSTILLNATTPSLGVAYQGPKNQPEATFQAVGTTTAGAGASVVDIEVSNDGVNWLVLGTISLTLSTTAASDGFVSAAPWGYIRAEVRSISGTGASVSVFMGV